MEQSSEVISAVPTQKGFVETKADLTEKQRAYSGGGSFSKCDQVFHDLIDDDVERMNEVHCNSSKKHR